jgi:hypothetical protein
MPDQSVTGFRAFLAPIVELFNRSRARERKTYVFRTYCLHLCTGNLSSPGMVTDEATAISLFAGFSDKVP